MFPVPSPSPSPSLTISRHNSYYLNMSEMKSCNTNCDVLFPVLPLNNYNVQQIFKTVSLKTEGRYHSLGYLLGIPAYSRLYGFRLGSLLNIVACRPVAAAREYIEGPHHSWRRIIYSLDCFDKTSVANELIPYTEPPAGL